MKPKQREPIFKKKLIRRIGGGVGALILFAIFTAGTAFTVKAQDKPAEIVRVGYYENEVFQEGAGEGAVKNGYAYEYYRKLSEYTGWKYEYIYGSYAELYQMLLDGEIDLLAGLAYKEDRAGLLSYPVLPMGNESYNLIKHDLDTDITADPATVNGKTIGVLDSALVDALKNYLEEQGLDAEVKTYDDYEKLYAAFDSNSVSLIAVEGDGAYGRDHAEVLCTFGTSDYYLCVNKNREDLLDELNTAQSQLAAEESNYINSLRIKYYKVSVSGRVLSSAERKWLDEHDELRVGYLNYYLPYSDTAADGSVTGIVKELVPKIFEKLATDIKITYTGYDSYDEMISDMSAEKIDAAFPVGGGMYYSEENGIYQSSPVATSSTELIFIGEYSDEKAKSFAINENNRMQYYYVKTYFPDAEIISCSSIEDCLEAVLNGRAGCTTLNGLRAGDILKNRKYRHLSMRQLSMNDDRCFGVEIGNEGLLKLLNRGINVVGADYARNLANMYTGGLYSYSFLDIVRDYIVVFGVIALSIALLVIYFLYREFKRKQNEINDKERARLAREEKNAELAKSREALAYALDMAENANKAKTTFLNNMSHDIRTPMNAIVGFTALAESYIDDKDLVKDYLGKISISSQHLLSLINDVLDMSRIESGKVAIEYTDVSIPDVVSEVSSIIHGSISGKQQELTVDISGIRNECVVTDKLRLNQVLLNILTNAVKFTPEHGRISFTAEEKPVAGEGMTCFEFRIKDNGIGIGKEFRKIIFEAFTRERSSTVSGIQGTGLGMAITKNIVDMMGGTIEVESTEGQGSEFIVNIPCKISDKTVKNAKQHSSKETFEGKRILLAEDNELNQQIATAILEGAGFAVDIARDGNEAVNMIREQRAGYYDVVLMDIQMPYKDGYEATREIRALEDKEKAAVPVLAVTANAFEEDRANAMEAGMNGHLAKPYNVPRMLETLSDILKNTETE